MTETEVATMACPYCLTEGAVVTYEMEGSPCVDERARVCVPEPRLPPGLHVMSKKAKLPTDVNSRGSKAIVDFATSDDELPDPDEGKDPAAVACGREGRPRGWSGPGRGAHA